MASKNSNVIISYFASVDKADTAANLLKSWDEANDAVKLGGIGILYWEDAKIKSTKVGGRATGPGAKWGTILGVATGILSGGVTLIGGAVVGAAGGAAGFSSSPIEVATRTAPAMIATPMMVATIRPDLDFRGCGRSGMAMAAAGVGPPSGAAMPSGAAIPSGAGAGATADESIVELSAAVSARRSMSPESSFAADPRDAPAGGGGLEGEDAVSALSENRTEDSLRAPVAGATGAGSGALVVTSCSLPAWS